MSSAHKVRCSAATTLPIGPCTLRSSSSARRISTAQLHRCHALRVYKKWHRSFEQMDRVNVDTALSHIAAPWKAARDGQDRDSHWLWHDIRKAVDSLVMRLKGAAHFLSDLLAAGLNALAFVAPEKVLLNRPDDITVSIARILERVPHAVFANSGALPSCENSAQRPGR